jgi:hypothetical protein
MPLLSLALFPSRNGLMRNFFAHSVIASSDAAGRSRPAFAQCRRTSEMLNSALDFDGQG